MNFFNLKSLLRKGCGCKLRNQGQKFNALSNKFLQVTKSSQIERGKHISQIIWKVLYALLLNIIVKFLAKSHQSNFHNTKKIRWNWKINN